MGALDFSEIPAANDGPKRDDWELFAREFLKWKQFHVVDGPDSGVDLERDLIVEEVRQGPGGETRLRWLVSCKHFAPSGKPVAPSHESNIGDRLKLHNCDGFMAFYSTICTNKLGQILRAQDQVIICDSASIERELLASPDGLVLSLRFMPDSTEAWRQKMSRFGSGPHGNVFREVVSDHYFMRRPHLTLQPALSEATERGLLPLVLIYVDEPDGRTLFAECISRFFEYVGVRHMVKENFVPAVISTQDDGAAELILGFEPAGEGWWVALGPDGSTIRSGALTASPDDGLKYIKEIIQASHLGPWNANREPGYPRYVFRPLREMAIGACMALLQALPHGRAAWILVDHEGIVITFDGWYLPTRERLEPSESERREWIKMVLKYPSLVNWDAQEVSRASVVPAWQIP